MSFNIDKKSPLAEQGVWAEYDGSKFLITHISNVRFQRTLQRLQQPHRRRIDSGTLDPALSKELLCKAMSESLLLDWSDVVDSNGQAVPYSREVAFGALMYNPEFREFVSEFAMNLTNFTEEEIREKVSG